MKAQIILKNLQWLGRHNPGFTPGSAQTAVAELLNPSASILPYRAWLYLEEWAVVGSNIAFFNIDAGATKNVNFQITMPTEERVYPVYLKIWSGDQLLETYWADEDVVIGVIAKTITVALKNPPSGATKWQMSVIDWDITEIMSWGAKEQDNIRESATFNIPPEWKFPLRIGIRIYQKLNDKSQQLYSVQSYRPYLYDWDTGTYTGPPDPDYREVFIPEYGDYYYNVATERFEKI